MKNFGNFEYSIGSYISDENAYTIFLYYNGDGFGEILFYDEDPNKKMIIKIYKSSKNCFINVGFFELQNLLQIALEEFEWLKQEKGINKKLF